MKASFRTCTNCRVDKSLNDFYQKPKGYLGVDRKCKQCVLQLKRQYYKIKSKAKKGEITLLDVGRLPIPERAIYLFFRMKGH